MKGFGGRSDLKEGKLALNGDKLVKYRSFLGLIVERNYVSGAALAIRGSNGIRSRNRCKTFRWVEGKSWLSRQMMERDS